ncbi:MAG: glycosyltransferase [Bacteroidota bacterium]
MISFYLFCFLIYSVQLIFLIRSWSEGRKQMDENDYSEPVSLLIPFRNESENIEELCRQLAKVTPSVAEVLLIDDHSEDDSRSKLERCSGSISKLKIIDNPGQGKKTALAHGVAMAKGSIILTSDADCFFQDGWVKQMLLPFADPKIQLVAGPVLSRIERAGFLDRFQQVEWASILLLTHFFFIKKQPLMCSGANLAYRKSAFLKVNGYAGNEEIASGDDEFLLKKIVLEFSGDSCQYLSRNETLVLTRPQNDFFEMLNQRKRWAGKWSYHSSISHSLTAVFFGVLQMVWLGSVTLLFLGLFSIISFFAIWLGKILLEKWVLGKVLYSFNKEPSFGVFLKTSLFHPVYVISTIFGIIFGKYTWKGRSQ